MRKQMKRWVELIATIAIVVAMLPGMALTAKAESGTVVDRGKAGDNITYKIFRRSGGGYHLELSGSGEMYDYNYGSNGKEIAPWMTGSYLSGISSIALTEGITYIGSGAFTNSNSNLQWSALQSVSLPQGLLTLGEGCLAYQQISYLRIPSTVETIGRDALLNFYPSQMTLPANLRLIDNGGISYLITKTTLYYPKTKEVFQNSVEDRGTEIHIGVIDYVQFGSVDGNYNNYVKYTPWTEKGEEPDHPNRVVSPWAEWEVNRAEELGLIPDSLLDTDLTRRITRAEFAAVAVRVYENLSPTPAIPAVNNPFRDTNDTEVLKAYNIGAVNGTSLTTYEPYTILQREQCAAMLTRVFKRVTIPGWTLANDARYPLSFTWPRTFADDARISNYARESVYFMAANGIIKGVGNNTFAPRNVTSAEEAAGYATATREQALAIARRMAENLK